MDTLLGAGFARWHTMGLCWPKNLTSGTMSPTVHWRGFLFEKRLWFLCVSALAFSMSLLGSSPTISFTHWAHSQARATINVTKSTEVAAMPFWIPCFGHSPVCILVVGDSLWHRNHLPRRMHCHTRETYDQQSFAYLFQVFYLSLASSCRQCISCPFFNAPQLS